MLSNVTLDTNTVNSTLYGVGISDEINRSFNEVLSQSLSTNYDLLTEHFKEILPKCVINEIDTSKVNGWDRWDFPKDKAFDENCTLDDLQSIKLKGAAPVNQLDPRAQKAMDFVTQNAVSILISPEAVERMNNDDEFFKKVMTGLSKILYPGVLDDMRETYTYQRGDITYKSITTDACIVATVSSEGEVESQSVVWGISQHIDVNAPSCDSVLAKKAEKEKAKGKEAEQATELFLDNVYSMRGNLDLQMGESVSLMTRKKNIV